MKKKYIFTFQNETMLTVKWKVMLTFVNFYFIYLEKVFSYLFIAKYLVRTSKLILCNTAVSVFI